VRTAFAYGGHAEEAERLAAEARDAGLDGGMYPR
jgi:hypothetical protein